ncbi:hypothetical protein AL035_17825 [Salipiger aestuarii]|uniref:Uncharacterized protein n=1 Tax=Salipiger aestuarii TaxID=568098 RepID=A0A327YW23_9RHOB|nr:hypothetical protein AL035_17825 [Salipiger aestuarii]RAK24097.1 hypothetical protein ATI53_1001204 [Salipiger aestuarii]
MMGGGHEQFAVAKTRPGRAGKVPVAIWDLLVWAFQVECVGLDFDEMGSTSGARPGVGMEYILMKRGDLGCTIDGGGRSDPHPDADLVASAVSCLPEGCGGRGMAACIAELARLGRWPDQWQHMTPSCEPAAWKDHWRGRFAEKSIWDGPGRWPANQIGRDDGYCCRVVFTGMAAEQARARRAWLNWWGALLELRCTFQMRCDLTGFMITDEMPPRAPWKKRS